MNTAQIEAWRFMIGGALIGVSIAAATGIALLAVMIVRGGTDCPDEAEGAEVPPPDALELVRLRDLDSRDD